MLDHRGTPSVTAAAPWWARGARPHAPAFRGASLAGHERGIEVQCECQPESGPCHDGCMVSRPDDLTADAGGRAKDNGTEPHSRACLGVACARCGCGRGVRSLRPLNRTGNAWHTRVWCEASAATATIADSEAKQRWGATPVLGCASDLLAHGVGTASTCCACADATVARGASTHGARPRRSRRGCRWLSGGNWGRAPCFVVPWACLRTVWAWHLGVVPVPTRG
jgi:hypothetical protein